MSTTAHTRRRRRSVMPERNGVRGLRSRRRPALDLRFRATIDAVPVARHSLGRWLEELKVDRNTREELALVVTELVTNAVEASPGPQHEVILQVECERDRIALHVTDEGSGFDQQQQTEPPEPTAVRGRGLPIVHALMDDVTIDRHENRTLVRTTRSLTDHAN